MPSWLRVVGKTSVPSVVKSFRPCGGSQAWRRDTLLVEAMGMTAVALAPAIGATVGFNWGTADP